MKIRIVMAALWILLCGRAGAQPFSYGLPGGNGAPGTIIAEEPMQGPVGADAWRVLYRSTDPRGAPIAVSGIVIIPLGKAPPGGRAIVAWAHPTSGVVPKCAPSLARYFFRQVQGLQDMIGRGYIVAATDYPGLGTPGPHPYMIGISEAHAVIDSVRAARALAGASAGNRFAVWGHSQGGQAALFTGLIARSYAPELGLVGIAAAAPPTDLRALIADDIDTNGGRNLTAMTFYSWSRLYDLSLQGIVEPQAMPAVAALSNECIESIFDIIERRISQRPLKRVFLANGNFENIAPWSSLIAANSAGPLPPNIPVFLAQGTADGLVRPDITTAYFWKLCRGESSVRYLLLPGVNHAWAAKKSAPDAIQWIADRFAGATPPSDCR
ncbi:MAG TPA: alpha/beta fold hydrolase [Rhizomicrobium sp.]|nr:alpha/beta fold hydrolase [Rhizomicrobium sp.]